MSRSASSLCPFTPRRFVLFRLFRLGNRLNVWLLDLNVRLPFICRRAERANEELGVNDLAIRKTARFAGIVGFWHGAPFQPRANRCQTARKNARHRGKQLPRTERHSL